MIRRNIVIFIRTDLSHATPPKSSKCPPASAAAAKYIVKNHPRNVCTLPMKLANDSRRHSKQRRGSSNRALVCTHETRRMFVQLVRGGQLILYSGNIFLHLYDLGCAGQRRRELSLCLVSSHMLFTTFRMVETKNESKQGNIISDDLHKKYKV